MSFQPSCEEKSQPGSSRSHKKPRRRRKKKQTAKNNLRFIGNKRSGNNTMCSWSGSSITGALEMKHQLAYWKARAMSLEYENQILHQIIRKNCLEKSETTVTQTESETSDVGNQLSEDEEIDHESGEENDLEDNLEVSEEFIAFLTANAKFKEDARLERERLKAKLAEEAATEDEEDKSEESRRNKAIEQYGQNWRKIAALEMFVQSNFINESDKSKPTYWPNIPFNFS